jgi:hypothetical protein
MNRRGLLCLAALALAACTSSDGDAENTTPETVASTTSVASTTTTTKPATTTTSTTTTTTLAPTTTVDPIAELEAAVKQARLDGEAAINAAGLDPTNQALRSEVAQYNSGPRLEETTAFLDQLAADGLAFRQDDELPSFLEFDGDVDFPDGAASTDAFLTECRVDTDIVYVVQDNPDAPELVVDDLVVSFRARVRYSLVDGQWQNTGGELLVRAEGVPACG